MGQSSPVYATDFESMNTYMAPTNWTNMGGIIQVQTYGAINGSKSTRFGGNTNTSIVAMPSISNINTLQITFSHKSSADDAGTFEIGYVTSTSDATTFIALDSYSASSYTSATTVTISLSAVSSGAYIAFRHTTATAYKYWYIDDITVELPSASCSTPTDLSAVTTSSTTANISWTAGGSETEWLLYYSKSSTAPADDVYSGTGVVTDINETSYTLEGLDDYTTYYVWVRAKCGEDDYSDWTDVVSFTTFNPQSLPVINDFEDGEDDLEDWIMRDANANTGVFDSETYSSSSYCFRFYSPYSGSTQYLITPELNGTTNGVYVQFYRKQPYAGAYIQVGYSTETISTEDFIWSEATPNAAATKYVSYELYCPAGTKFVAIKYTSTTSTPIYIDNISITVPPTANTNGNWNNAATWATGAVPSSSANVVISSDVTIPNGYTATANNITIDGGSLTIEDGGQLILPKTSTGVQATVKKETYGATTKDTKTDYYWYAISSAVADPNIASATNIASSGTYDLYRYNEEKNAELPWENYKNTAYSSTFTTLEKGRGYLYRNASNLSIEMTGEINVADFNYAVTKTGSGVLAGFNLIGNPYSHDIYKGAGTAIPNGSGLLRTGFYYMEPTTGKWTAGTDNSTAIKPNQGVLVQTDANGSIEMTNTNSNGSSKSNNDNIMFKVANSQYSDEAYAWFDKGRGLNKISHRNAEVPMLYINQDGEDYAIATMSDDIKTFSLNFKAMTMGKYTLSYKTKGEFNYLHVIDRFTGEDVDMLLEGEYSFVASPNDSDARFIVRLEYTSNNGTNDSSVFAYQSGNEIIVSGEGELQIFDVMGRKISTHQINGVETVNVNAHGVYIFKLNEKTQKIIIK